MRISKVIWKDFFIEKIAAKHDVSVDEVEEALSENAVVRKLCRGHVRGDDLYSAQAQIESGRHLIVFFIRKKNGAVLPISARDMNQAERKYYEKQK